MLASSRHINTTGDDIDTGKWWYQMVHPYDVFADGADEITKAVREEIRRGAEMVKVFPTSGQGAAGRGRGLTHRELLAAVEAAHDRGERIRGHCCWPESITECIEAGVDIIDHGDEMDERGVELTAEHGTAWMPELAFLKFPRDLPDGALDLPIGEVRRDWDNLCRMLPLANDAGVRIIPGDDHGLPMLPHAPGIYAKELTLYVNEVGIKPLDVLRWATANGGMFFGSGFGTVTQGAPADLLVAAADPSVDITVFESSASTLRTVMIAGRFVKDEVASLVPGHESPLRAAGAH